MQLQERTLFGSRRDLLGDAAKLAAGGTLAAALTRFGFDRAAAQATPAAPTGYPELTVTITDEGFQASASEVPAGYLLLTGVNRSRSASSVGLIGPRPGQTMQQLMNEAAKELASPQAANEFLAPFFYAASLPGGPIAIPPGGSGRAIVQVTAGDWAIWGGSATSNPAPVSFTAAAGATGAQTAPAATVVITEVDFAFGGFGRAIPAGPQTWKVVNQGTQPHMFSVSQIPAGTTLIQVLAAMSAPDNATPAAGGLGRADFQDRGGVIAQSPGMTAWPLLDLPAGHYAAMCLVGDPTHGGKPHAMEGMIAVFDAGSSETAPATPTS